MKTRQMQTYRGRRRAAAAAAAAAAASGLPCLDQSGRLVDQSAISFDSKRPYRVSLAKLGFVGWFVLFVFFFAIKIQEKLATLVERPILDRRRNDGNQKWQPKRERKENSVKTR